ncbi:MAG: hypothetical protein EZS28_003837 [Streblomastix strix]|uniref:Reverse transcriptase domain-containing protein n=1 Tax=Streblomastix strix TaxID=222440 RepID=A0A5J4X068_9EUKA|nr:MAG: hypothetical protein EZS28_003837 [Streblomastix strix]
MSGSNDNGNVHQKTKILFGKLKYIAIMFVGIDDFDNFATKMRKWKRNEDESSSGNEKPSENSCSSEYVMQHPPKRRKRRMNNETSDKETSVATPSPPPRKLHKDKEHKKTVKKSKLLHQNKRPPSMSKNSLCESQSTASKIESSDDSLVYRELQKITGESKCACSRVDKVNFQTVDSPQRWEGHDDEDGAESVILSAVTTNSVLLVAEEAAKDSRSWKKLLELIMRTFRLSHQTSVHAQAALEALVLNERGKFLKAATPSPIAIRQSGVGEMLDPSVAQHKERKEQKRDKPQNSQIQEISEEIGGRLMRFRAAWTTIGAEMQVLMGIMPVWKDKGSELRLQHLSKITQLRGNIHQRMKLLQEEINQKFIIFVNPHHIKLYSPTFCIPIRDGSYRIILDARNLNIDTKRIHFKMISSKDVQFTIQQNDFLTSLDIRSAFNHIIVHPSLQHYLVFQVANASYFYICMPFGLKLATIVFSKTFQAALAASKESPSSTIQKYADDILLINKDKYVLIIETVT